MALPTPRTDSEFDSFVAALMAAPAHATFGLRYMGRDASDVRLAFTAGPSSVAPTGAVHGGVVAMLMEPAAGLAAMRALPSDRFAVTIDAHIQMLRAPSSGDTIELVARLERMTRQVAFCDAEARVGGAIVARGRYTKAIVGG